jgi:hypothetical protein
MVKYSLVLLFFFYSFIIFGQNKFSEQFPIFPNCENKEAKELESCFYNEVQTFVFQNFQVPANLKNPKTVVKVLFEVDENGSFKIQYVDAIEEDLIKESKRVFGKFPKIKPARYNGKPTYSKYTIRIAIPLQDPTEIKMESDEINPLLTSNKPNQNNNNKELNEFDAVALNYKKFQNPQFESNLNVPLSHSYYAQFDGAMNQVGTNNHTSSKPFTYAEVNKYFNLSEANSKMVKNKSLGGEEKYLMKIQLPFKAKIIGLQ